MDFETINSVLLKYEAELGVAEIHGIAVGMLCIDNHVSAKNWLIEIFVDVSPLTKQDHDLMLGLFEHIRRVLLPEEEQFTFDLFIPDDDIELHERAEAVRAWCLGFLFGIGFMDSGSLWAGECQEIVRDIVEITKMETDVYGETDELALMEIHEYLRTAVLMVRDHILTEKHSSLLHNRD